MHTPARRLRELLDAAHARREALAIPGAFNALCALAVKQAGFHACYVSGAATSVCAGVPDVGLLTLEHFVRQIREAADASGLPVFADADTGFGEAEMVRRTVLEYARAGAAGLHIEDQKFPKRCGHLDGKELVSTDHMCEKIQWAVKAAREAGEAVEPFRAGQKSSPETAAGQAFLICARTDARGVEGFAAAVERAFAYHRAGADMIFPEGLTTKEEFAQFASAMGRRPSAAHAEASTGPYLLANMTEFGKTPIIALQEFSAMGYSCVIYPVSMLRVAMGAVARALAALAQEGSVQGLLADMQTRQELYGLIGYQPGVPWESRP